MWKLGRTVRCVLNGDRIFVTKQFGDHYSKVLEVKYCSLKACLEGTSCVRNYNDGWIITYRLPRKIHQYKEEKSDKTGIILGGTEKIGLARFLACYTQICLNPE